SKPRRSGGIGRHTILRGWRREACGFESRLRHSKSLQSQEPLKASSFAFYYVPALCRERSRVAVKVAAMWLLDNTAHLAGNFSAPNPDNSVERLLGNGPNFREKELLKCPSASMQLQI